MDKLKNVLAYNKAGCSHNFAQHERDLCGVIIRHKLIYICAIYLQVGQMHVILKFNLKEDISD